MKKEKKPSGLSGMIAAIILIAVMAPILKIVGGIVSLLIICSMLAAVFYILYSVIMYIRGKKDSHIISDNSRNDDILFYQKFISENQKVSPSENRDDHQIISFDFRNNDESFDENYFKADAVANTISDLKAQDRFWDTFFERIAESNDLHSSIKSRAVSAKEYTDMVQGIKRTLGIYSSRKCGYSESTYYTFMNKNLMESDFSPETGIEFEEYCASILSKNGFEQVEVTQASGDQGIDITAYSQGVKYGFQCKFYSKPVGNKAVQEAFAGKEFYKCHVAVVLTNNSFTKSAVDLANRLGVVLWDGAVLNKLEAN